VNIQAHNLQQQIQQLNTPNAPVSSMPSGVGFGSGPDFADLLRRSQTGSGAREAGSPPPNVPPIVQNMELFEVALELETILVQNMIRSMRNTVERSNLIDTGFAGEVYEDMLFEEYARIVTRNASFGFAEMVYRELSGHPQRRN